MADATWGEHAMAALTIALGWFKDLAAPVGAVLGTVMLLRQRTLHLMINSRMDQLLSVSKGEAFTKGQQKGEKIGEEIPFGFGTSCPCWGPFANPSPSPIST